MNSITEETVLHILFDHYAENDLVDTREMKQKFYHLDQILQELSFRDYDMVWDAAIHLCVLHEQRGFEAGFRMGAALARELTEPGQGKHS